jgi:glycosyltransferase involved in cell wall biosynthesis
MVNINISSEPIRIAYVIDNLRREGAQKHLTDLVAGLNERGYQQRVYCLNNSFNAEVVRLLSVNGSRVVIVGRSQLLTLTGIVKILIDFKRWRPSIVQTFLPFANNLGCAIAHAANVPVVAKSIRARDVDKHMLHFFIDRLTTRQVDSVVLNSKQLIPFVMEKEGIKPEQIVHIPNGIKVKPRDSSSAISDLLSELGINPKAQVVGIVARLYPQKGHVYLLKAFTKVLADKPDTILIIIGDGPLRQELEAEATKMGISQQTLFLGERSDVQDLLGCINVYVQSSLWEGMPNAVMEAMAAGKPVIASSVDGTIELIEEGKTGWLVKPADVDALSKRIIYALNNREEAMSIGGKAARSVIEKFSLERMISEYDDFYKRKVKHHMNLSHKSIENLPGDVV